MKIVGCDLHTRYQQIAMLDEETGELVERRLEHGNGEAKEFYTKLSGPAAGGLGLSDVSQPRRGCPRSLAFGDRGWWPHFPRTSDSEL